MVRTLASTVSLGVALLLARSATATPVSPVDLDAVTVGAPIGSAMSGDFTTVTSRNGDVSTRVFFDGVKYVYTHTVTPSNHVAFVFSTEFNIAAFTGLAGWRFADAASAGATGNGRDFHIEDAGRAFPGGQGPTRLVWFANEGGAFGKWDAFEPITFFFASTKPPEVKNYSLITLLPVQLGTAQGLAPIPEPGSIALFGSGLVALYTARRRRRKVGL